MARRRVRGLVTIGGVVATLVAGLLTASPASAAGAPVVRDITISGTAITAPGSVTLGYTATVDSPVYFARADYLDSRGLTRSIVLSTGQSGSGELTVVDGRPNGTWKLQSLSLYSNDGPAMVCRTDNPTTACTDRRDLSPYDVVVSGSHEDFDAPLLTGVTVSPARLAPGDLVTVAWSAEDAHALESTSFTFKNARPETRGEPFSLVPTATELKAGTVSRRVPTLFNGLYVLDSARTRDALGNAAAFRSDGSVAPTAPATGPTQHSVDFAGVGFEVSGSPRDDSPPVLGAISSAGAPPAVNRDFPVSYAASDPSGLRSVTFTWTDQKGGNTTFFAEGNPVPTTGRVVYVPRSIGTHRLSRVNLTDAVGYSIEYRRDGTTWNPLTQVRGTHSLDFAALDLTVKPSAVSSLTARSRPGSAELSWAESSDELPDITGYRIVVSPGNRVIDLPSPAPGAPLVHTVTGLANATRYSFSVTPTSAFGNGPSRSASTVPLISGNVFGGGDVTGDRRDDLWALLPKGDWPLRLYRGTNAPGYRSATTTQLSDQRLYPAAPSDGYAAYLVVDGIGRLETRHVDRNGTLTYPTLSGSGWGGMRFIDGSADLSGDRVADIVAVTESGQARLYRGRGNGSYAAGTFLQSGWQSMTRVFVPGDVTGDRKADIVTIDSAGSLWIYRGNGKGGFLGRVKVGSGWGGLGALFSARDANGDGRGDLGAITMNGELRIYKGRGNGTFTGATVIGTGWGSYL